MFNLVGETKGDFYPTPNHLIEKMLKGIDFNLVETVLEPSAGTGLIAKRVKDKWKLTVRYSKKEADIDCIEIDPNLRHVLKGEGNRVIHDDFLTYECYKRYDLIIMNPPFSEGDKHLLKALHIQRRGGAVVCLLNAETIRNPYNSTRRELVKLLKQYSAKIEYIPGAFLDAQRLTDVEVALIRVNIPHETEPSEIYEKLKAAKEIEFASLENKSLVVNDLIKAITMQYQVEVEASLELFRQYNALKPYMQREFNDRSETLLVLSTYDSHYRYSIEEGNVNHYLKLVRYKYWRTLFANPEFTKKFTSDVSEKFFGMLETLKDYDFTILNIETIAREANALVHTSIKDTILKLFDRMSEEHSYYPECRNNAHYYDGWCHNKAHKVNKKIILPCYGVFEDQRWGGRFRSYKAADALNDIEKALSYLDGKGIQSDISLEGRIAAHGSTSKIPCKYFNVSFYKKGTMHIEFTDLQLLDRFNIFCSLQRHWLPPYYGRKNYADLNVHDKAVIDCFQGEEAYEKVVADNNSYICSFDSIPLLCS